MLKLKNVSKYYAKDGVITSGFSKINLELHLGEFVVITGESGSGKSTLLNVLSGLDSYEDGEMYINGEETSHYGENEYLRYRRKYVSNIFQNFNLVNSYTVYENIELAMIMNGKVKKDIRKEVLELISKVGLKKYKNTPTSKLSGGQKQRVAIARALANNTPVIVADEPTGSLDSKSSKDILKLLHEISKDKLVIIVTHNKEEIEKYATRLIKMHDGRIVEDKIIEKINLDSELEEAEVKSITFINKIKLGIKNTFNLPIKFILMFSIYLLITIALITNYGIFMATEYESDTVGFTEYFIDSSDKRVIIKKDDQTIFNDSDYEKIKNISNIDYIVENDILIDADFSIYSDMYYLYGSINTSSLSEVDVGTLPKNDNEIVIKGSKNIWYLANDTEGLLNETFKLELYNGTYNEEKLKIVGIIYDEEESNLYTDYIEFYLNDALLEKVSNSLNERYYNTSYIINDKYINDIYGIKISNKVKEGEVYIGENLNGYCKNFKCNNSTLTINNKNIYVDDKLTLNISKTYNHDNIKSILNEEYENGMIYINENDYNNLFNKGNYQSSIYVKELKDLDNTVKELNDLGYNTLKLKDAKYNEGSEIFRIIKIFKLIVTVALIVTLFFISYFIIKIIYKSRISYYTTLRTLGGTKKICTDILRNELLTIATFVYSLFIIFIISITKGIFEFEYFKEITKYIGISEYVLVYIILILISLLISYRYGRKIFAASIIKTYGERV